jgi:uncharacterized membrane protein
VVYNYSTALLVIFFAAIFHFATFLSHQKVYCNLDTMLLIINLSPLLLVQRVKKNVTNQKLNAQARVDTQQIKDPCV